MAMAIFRNFENFRVETKNRKFLVGPNGVLERKFFGRLPSLARALVFASILLLSAENKKEFEPNRETNINDRRDKKDKTDHGLKINEIKEANRRSWITVPYYNTLPKSFLFLIPFFSHLLIDNLPPLFSPMFDFKILSLFKNQNQPFHH